MGKIFAIGDIHGCFDKLENLIEKIDIDFNNDTIVFMGDYIDRGPDSFKVVDFLIKIKKMCPKAFFLKGNHELMFENYLSGEDMSSFLQNGGRMTIESYAMESKEGNRFYMPPEHTEFFNSLELYYETDEYIFVHAGLREHVPLEKQTADDFLWIRNDFLKSHVDFGKIVVFGHTPFSDPRVNDNKIGIDTGAVYGNKLTCLKLPDLFFYSE
jgi:serine/threonine protein phosphatase 1